MDKLFIIFLFLIGFGTLSAADSVERLAADPTLRRGKERLEVSVNMDLRNMKVGSNQALLVTPVLVNGVDSLELHSVGIYGRRRHIYYIRNHGGPVSGDTEEMFLAGDKPATLQYTESLPLQPWMDGAELKLYRRTFGCCNRILSENCTVIGSYEEFHPQFFFMQPTNVDAEKARTLSGSAFIDFPVNKTVIYPEYHNNVAELAKINATIDSVRQDADVTIREVWLKGFASPESPYSHNTMLAKGRVAALKDYIQKLYNFAPGVIATEFEPEDWEGLRRRVDASNLDHRAEILELIDSSTEPDRKEQIIKTKYPAEYKFMLANWYPWLRHTDYRIEYVIRSYYDPAEIAEVMKKAPQNLSLNEFFILSNSLEPGTPEFSEVWETAVRMYPDDPTANYNAAMSALQNNDLARADKLLLKAGNSLEADYARGISAMIKEDYSEARRLFELSAAKGLPQAADALKQLEKMSPLKASL